jgi:hypothetical protein
MPAAAARIAAYLVTDKRFWKVLAALFLIVVLIVTAVGTSCAAHNIQYYAANQVASDFAPLVASANAEMEEGQQINTQLLYASYITLFDNQNYTDKDNVRKKLITCFYTVTTKKVTETDEDGNTVLDTDGKPKHKTITVFNEITDSTEIFSKTETKFNIKISDSERQYILSLAEILTSSGSSSLSDNVYAYEPLINQYCAKYGIPKYSSLILAIMQTESGGSGSDPMQCSESPCNTKYPHTPDSITDPEYSINVGIQYFASCLKAAKCKSPQDISGMSLALQGYNYGGGYISWAINRDGGYTQENAQVFSEMKKEQLGTSVYGNPNYAQKVLSYYNAAGSGTFSYPIQKGLYTISSPFGSRIDPMTGKVENHKGVDFAASQGTPIFAGESGTVIYAQFGTFPYSGYGNVVVIRHSSTLISLYGHCSKLLVTQGQTVQKGQEIALVGSTGDSTGNHCHFEIRVSNSSVDPMTYLN